MSRSEDSRRALWECAGHQCAICHADVYPKASAEPQQLVGIEFVIDERNPGEPDAAGDAVLLCVNDAMTVTQNRDAFTGDRLRQLKAALERIQLRRLRIDEPGATRSDRVRVLCHVASFSGNPNSFVFVKVANDSLTLPVVIDEIWFATDPVVTIQNINRPLPTSLAPRELFETWQPLSDLPLRPDILELVRVRLADGTVATSRVNTDVAPAGMVGGPGSPLSRLRVNDEIVGSNASDRWDVFISHAAADKATVGRPLKEALEWHGLRVWFDDAVLRIGDSLRRKIDEGLRNSGAGVVILSPAFFDRGWPNYELDGMVTLDRSGLQNILPIWHNVTFEQVRDFSPSLADRVARHTGTATIDQIAEEIARRVRPELFREDPGQS